jgi:DNA-binding protein Fis
MTLLQARILIIKSAIDHCRGNKTHTAKMLGISLRSLRLWIRDHEDLRGYKGKLGHFYDE